MSRLNILILHNLGHVSSWRTSVYELEYMLPLCFPEHNYIVYPCNPFIPPSDDLKSIQFDAIILGPTFLYLRNYPDMFSMVMLEFDFIGESKAFKVALPQDDYNCSALLDKWMVDWHIDLVYTVLPEHKNLIYSSYIKIGKVEPGYTGYISERSLNRWRYPKTSSLRITDVSYRSKKIAPNYGRIGVMKSKIGEVFNDHTIGCNFVTDISTETNDIIYGDKWLDFVENSKFVLGAPSGSSILDHDGSIKKNVDDFLSYNPNASFEDVEQSCFFGHDSKYIMTAISPRNLEASLALTTQILIPNSYNNIFKPWEHYIPFEFDGTNSLEVIDSIKDFEKSFKIAFKNKETILSLDELRLNNRATQIMDKIFEHKESEKIPRKVDNTVFEEIKKYVQLSHECSFRFDFSIKHIKNNFNLCGDKFSSMGKTIIVHAPSASRDKGTDYINSVICKLKLEYNNLEYREIKNMSHQQVINTLFTAHIVIDQILDGNSMRELSFEAMLCGCAVVQATALDDNNRQIWHIANKDNLEFEMKKLLDSQETIRDIATRCFDFARLMIKYGSKCQ